MDEERQVVSGGGQVEHVGVGGVCEGWLEHVGVCGAGSNSQSVWGWVGGWSYAGRESGGDSWGCPVEIEWCVQLAVGVDSISMFSHCVQCSQIYLVLYGQFEIKLYTTNTSITAQRNLKYREIFFSFSFFFSWYILQVCKKKKKLTQCGMHEYYNSKFFGRQIVLQFLH